jgi:hypothetical protein
MTAALLWMGIVSMTGASAQDPSSAIVVSAVKAVEIASDSSDARVVLADGQGYTLRRQEPAFAFWCGLLAKYVGDPNEAVYVEYEPGTRLIGRLRLTDAWEGVQLASAPRDGRLAVWFRVSAAIHFVRTDRAEYARWKAILDEAAATQKTVRVVKDERSYELLFVGWSGPQPPHTDVARVERFDDAAEAREAVLLTRSGWRMVLRREAPDFETWRQRIAEALRDDLPLRVKYEPSTRQVIEILRVLRRRVVRIAAAERRSRVYLEGDAAAFFLTAETVPLVYTIWRRQLEQAARTGESMLIVTQPETRDILLAVPR